LTAESQSGTIIVQVSAKLSARYFYETSVIVIRRIAGGYGRSFIPRANTGATLARHFIPAVPKRDSAL